MAGEKHISKHYLLASDFDHALSFNDSSVIRSELLGIEGIQAKIAEISGKTFIQKGGELSYLLLHDLEYKQVRAAHLVGKLLPTRRNQLWVADITYIRLAVEFIYLAVVLDAYSRLVIGWSLDRTLEAKLAVAALQMAINKREHTCRVDPSLGSRRAIRLRRLHDIARRPQDPDQHERQG